MRNKNIVKYKTEKLELIELIYYDGVKLQVDLTNNIVLAWYDELKDNEEWFHIDLKKDIFIDYISNKLSLFDIIKIGKVELIERKYDDYNHLILIDSEVEINARYEFPDKDSFLGFDITKEQVYIEHLFKSYVREIKISVQNRKVSYCSKQKQKNYEYKQKEEIYEVA